MKLSMQKKPPEHVTWDIVSSPAGKLVAGWNDKGEICRVSYLKRQIAKAVVADWSRLWKSTRFTKGKVIGDISEKDVALIGTKFQQTVLRAVTEIPAGKVTTFAKLARRIGKPKASRAVGAACRGNPLRYLIPCYRVLGSDGSLRDSASGFDVQKKLLKAEGYLCKGTKALD
jgi:methylated-DNA-[protein]-cysteine S-methyltransferase